MMHARSDLRQEPAGDTALSPAEAIALRYRNAAGGDVWLALVQAVEDALAELEAADAQALVRERLISGGYVRARLDV